MITITVRMMVTSRAEERHMIQKGYIGICSTRGDSFTVVNDYKMNIIFAWDCPSLSLKLG